ncbi:hypothetical protein [Variovorax sp. HJSM1_2]|uniref:hypothetical protein n=1 Tax=Variovorax sp. HJSM1_2 TaxID=3366263 RepID=UPI003BC7B5BC
MPKWTPFPHAGAYAFTPATTKKNWAVLHRGDKEPLPRSAAELAAWAHYHAGDFEQAEAAGLAAGGSGLMAANKAAIVYANYLEPREKSRLERLMAVAERAHAQTETEPNNANAWFLHAYALGRYSQGISVAKALAQGLGTKVKEALEKTIALVPDHAEAHIALGMFHADVIDKVGLLIASMTYGVKKEESLRLLREALRLMPESSIGMVEYANALLMLEGEKLLPEATALYEKAGAITPIDAADRLAVDLARSELAD